MSVTGNVSQVQHMAQAVLSFGSAQSANKQQNLRHLELLQAKQRDVASQVVDQAVESRSQAADLKGRIIDAMV